MKPTMKADGTDGRDIIEMAKELSAHALVASDSRWRAANALLLAGILIVAEDFGIEAAASMIGQMLDDSAAGARRAAAH